MGKESALCKVRDDSACEQNGESRCFRVSLRQPQGQLCWLSLLLLLLPAATAGVPTPLAPRQGFGLLQLQQAPGRRWERGRGGWAVPHSGNGSAPAARSAGGGETEPIPCRKD